MKKRARYLISKRTYKVALGVTANRRLHALFEMRRRLGETGITIESMLADIVEGYLDGS